MNAHVTHYVTNTSCAYLSSGKCLNNERAATAHPSCSNVNAPTTTTTTTTTNSSPSLADQYLCLSLNEFKSEPKNNQAIDRHTIVITFLIHTSGVDNNYNTVANNNNNTFGIQQTHKNASGSIKIAKVVSLGKRVSLSHYVSFFSFFSLCNNCCLGLLFSRLSNLSIYTQMGRVSLRISKNLANSTLF